MIERSIIIIIFLKGLLNSLDDLFCRWPLFRIYFQHICHKILEFLAVACCDLRIVSLKDPLLAGLILLVMEGVS